MKAACELTRTELNEWIYQLSITRYVESLGFEPYLWQKEIYRSEHKRKLINGARQSGKSTLISSKPCHRSKYWPGSLSIIIAATEEQAIEDMRKVKDFIARDPDYPRLVRDADTLLELSNKSRIVVRPATEKGARGQSSPDLIILDEASRIEDAVYKGAVRSMLTDNEKCELAAISTPNGREGFFFRAWESSRWEHYEIRSQWDVDEEGWRLVPAMPEKAFREPREKKGIRAFYSPRHRNLEEQQENLEEIGPLMYRQENNVEFVEPEDQVFSYEEVEKMFSREVKSMDFGLVKEREVAALEVRG